MLLEEELLELPLRLLEPDEVPLLEPLLLPLRTLLPELPVRPLLLVPLLFPLLLLGRLTLPELPVRPLLEPLFTVPLWLLPLLFELFTRPLLELLPVRPLLEPPLLLGEGGGVLPPLLLPPFTLLLSLIHI